MPVHEAFPLIRAVVEGRQAGTVWTGGAPASGDRAVVWNRFGFMQWLGDCDDPQLNAEFEQCLLHGAEPLPRYILWYAPPPRWRSWLQGHLPELRMRERVRWAFHALPHAALAAPRAGLRLAPLSSELLPATEGLGLSLQTRFWSSAEDLLEHGLGMCVVKDSGQVVACAYSACVAGGQAEVDIAVDPQHRQQGLGVSVGRAFIEACLARGLQPAWDCFTSNQASMNLAFRLGFVPSHRYALVSFNVPLKPEAPPASA